MGRFQIFMLFPDGSVLDEIFPGVYNKTNVSLYSYMTK